MNPLEQVVEFLSVSYSNLKKAAIPAASAVILACGGGNGDGDDDDFGRDCSNDLDCRKPRVCEGYQCVYPEGYDPNGDVEKPDAGVPDQSSGRWPACPVKDYGECVDFYGTFQIAEVPNDRCAIPYDLSEFYFTSGKSCQEIVIGARATGENDVLCLRVYYRDDPDYHDDKSLPARGNHIENSAFALNGEHSFTLCNEDLVLLRWENDLCEAWLERSSFSFWKDHLDCIEDVPR